jgi:hypothetical protein
VTLKGGAGAATPTLSSFLGEVFIRHPFLIETLEKEHVI